MAFVEPTQNEDETNNSTKGSKLNKRSLFFSEGSIETAYIGVRFSLGKHKDDGICGPEDNAGPQETRDQPLLEGVNIAQLSNLRLN